jgi:SAM-dependent methyltransferase
MFCWLCQNEVEAFLPYGLPPRRGRCPHCNAKPRNRAVQWFLQERVCARLSDGGEVLEIGPSRTAALYHSRGTALGKAHYTAIDTRRLKFHDDLETPHHFELMNLTDLRFEDERFDLLICNNVLPYIADYRQALAEIYRCLKTDGLAMLNTPMRDGATLTVTQYRANHPELDDAYFAENGDQWMYGRDLLDYIRTANLVVRSETPFTSFAPDFLHHHGLQSDFEFILASKSAAGFERYRPPGDGRASA